jgi:hypothetical protein
VICRPLKGGGFAGERAADRDDLPQRKCSQFSGSDWFIRHMPTARNVLNQLSVDMWVAGGIVKYGLGVSSMSVALVSFCSAPRDGLDHLAKGTAVQVAVKCWPCRDGSPHVIRLRTNHPMALRCQAWAQSTTSRAAPPARSGCETEAEERTTAERIDPVVAKPAVSSAAVLISRCGLNPPR